MGKLIYSPKALEDLQLIKNEITKKFGLEVAKNSLRRLASLTRQLEIFPDEGGSVLKIR